jgi:hypothetical protein
MKIRKCKMTDEASVSRMLTGTKYKRIVERRNTNAF